MHHVLKEFVEYRLIRFKNGDILYFVIQRIMVNFRFAFKHLNENNRRSSPKNIIFREHFCVARVSRAGITGIFLTPLSSSSMMMINEGKVLYTIRTLGKCLLERTLVLGNRLCEVGWPVPFFASFISTVFPPDPHLLLGGQ